MYNLINVCFHIGNFNTGTTSYHHCLLSSNLGTILLGRKECHITYAYILDHFNFNFNSNSKCFHVYKFKYQNDHCANQQHLYDQLCNHAIIIQLSKVILMHNTVFTSISIHTKLIFLFVIL